MGTLLDDPVIARFRAALLETYGGRVERAVLYGSRARGEAGAGSDYDFAVVLSGITSQWAEMERLGDIGITILDDMGEVVHATPFGSGALEERTLLMHEIRKDGQDIF